MSSLRRETSRFPFWLLLPLGVLFLEHGLGACCHPHRARTPRTKLAALFAQVPLPFVPAPMPHCALPKLPHAFAVRRVECLVHTIARGRETRFLKHSQRFLIVVVAWALAENAPFWIVVHACSAECLHHFIVEDFRVFIGADSDRDVAE